jgi:hypothetical protein
MHLIELTKLCDFAVADKVGFKWVKDNDKLCTEEYTPPELLFWEKV